MTFVRDTLLVLSWIALVFFTLQALGCLYFALVSWRRLAADRRARAYEPLDEFFASPFAPYVSVLLPAYNEEAGVVAYRSRRHRNLRVLDKPNGGKADALNAGINAASHPYFCAIDADAILEQDSLLRIVKPVIDDPDLTAVGGIVRIANGATMEDGRMLDFRLPRSHLVVVRRWSTTGRS